MKYLVMLICLVFTNEGFCQTFHKEYNNTGNETISENILKIFDKNDTTIILGYEKNLSTVYYNLYIDNDGNQLKQVFRDTSTFRPQQRYKMNEHSLNVALGDQVGLILFNVVNDFGEIVKYAKVNLTTCGISMFYISDFLETTDRYIISGIIDEGDRSALIFMDHDFNIIECKITDDTFKDIPSIVQTEDERIFGIMAFTGYEMIDCGNCFYEARFYLAELSEDFFFDTIKIVYEGSSQLEDYKIPIESLSDNNILIAHELESMDPYFSYTDKLVVKSMNQLGDVNWAIDPLDIYYDGFSSYSFSTDFNNNIFFTCETAAPNDIGLENSITSVISMISIDGEVSWTKKFLRFVGDLGWTKSDKFKFRYIENPEYYTLLGRHTINQFVEKPLILRITKDGCFHEDCRKVEATGYFPPPRKMISYRNIWNVHNTEKDERYRYSFVEQAIPDIGGTMIRSDEMSGDNWYLTERQFWGGNRLTGEQGENGYFTDYQYNYDFDVGEYNSLIAPPEFDNRKLVVTDKDTIYFNDGRPMHRLTMECYRDDDKMEEYEPITWIELLGDPEHLFDTHNACRIRGSEVVTCFYSAGDLMWSHPDYVDCAPTGIEKVRIESAIVFPNPSYYNIQVNVKFGKYRIVSTCGQIMLTGNAIERGESIDIRHLSSGSYYIYETDRKDGKVISFTKF